MTEHELRAMRKRWQRWYEATKNKGANRFVPIDPIDVIRMLDEIDRLKEAK